MPKTLEKRGECYAVVLDPPLLERTGITPDTELEISTDGDVIVIAPVRASGRADKLQAGIEAINARYSGVLRRLAE